MKLSKSLTSRERLDDGIFLARFGVVAGGLLAGAADCGEDIVDEVR